MTDQAPPWPPLSPDAEPVGAPAGAGWVASPPASPWSTAPPAPWAVPPPAKRPVWQIVVAAVVGVVVGGIGGVGITVAVGIGLMEASQETFVVAYGSGGVAAEIEPGTCVTGAGITEPGATAVACEGVHDLEVYARRPLLTADAAAYPDALNLELLGEDLCMVEFEPYVAATYFDSALDFETAVPDPAAWAAGHRDVVCTLFHMDGDVLRGTSAGSGR